MHRFAYVAVILALGILAAHFYRSADVWLAVVAVAAMPLLAVRRAWVPRVLQALLALGALEWLRTLAELVAVRMSLHMPYVRLSAILAGVALLTIAAALAFELRALRRRYAQQV